MTCWCWTWTSDEDTLYHALDASAIYTDTWNGDIITGIDGADAVEITLSVSKHGRISHVKLCSPAEHPTALARLKPRFPDAEVCDGDMD